MAMKFHPKNTWLDDRLASLLCTAMSSYSILSVGPAVGNKVNHQVMALHQAWGGHQVLNRCHVVCPHPAGPGIFLPHSNSSSSSNCNTGSKALLGSLAVVQICLQDMACLLLPSKDKANVLPRVRLHRHSASTLASLVCR